MATIINYLPNQKKSKICGLGGDHENQALNLVCLDPLCRNSPLICASCFTETHKYHKVVGLSKFISDYQQNIGQTDFKMQQRKIAKHYGQMKELVKQFRCNINSTIATFEKSLHEYAAYLSGNSLIRDEVGKQLRLQLDPNKILSQNNKSQLQNSLKFILNNCLYDPNLNMINISNILKQNQERVSALLDKMVYMTQFCETTVEKALKNFDFAKQTLRQEKSALNEHIRKMNTSHNDPLNIKKFIQSKNSLANIVANNGNLILQQSQTIEAMHQFQQLNDLAHCEQNYKFGKNKHANITIKEAGKFASSDVTANNAHYVLAWPNLNNQPQNIRQWSIKILKCRDFASKNTMALGIGRLSDIKLANFEGNPTNTLLITSQGYVFLNGNYEKTDFVYREGDVIHFTYDPYYGIIEVQKDNGRKLSLRAIRACDRQPIYICAKLTYASDQVELI